MGSKDLHGKALGACRRSTLSPSLVLALPCDLVLNPLEEEDAIQLAITYRAVTDLKPYSRNARTHSRKQVKQIAAAIKEFGFTNPVLIDESDEIIAGHGRVAAAKLLGLRGGMDVFWLVCREIWRLSPPRDDEAKQESDCEGLERRCARQVRQTVTGTAGLATRLNGIGDALACRFNGLGPPSERLP